MNPQPPNVPESYFARCERDEGGQCLPEGQAGHQINNEFPIAGDVVDGREVLKEVPNQDSIDSSIDNPEILPGIREIKVADVLDPDYKPNPYSVQRRDRLQQLTEQIRESKKISPLIVAIDKDGPYVLEGSHRIDALYNLGAESFPAMVVVDLDSAGEDPQQWKWKYEPPQEKSFPFYSTKMYPPPPQAKESYFARCERDEGGQCLPEGQAGSEKPAESPNIESIEQEYVTTKQRASDVLWNKVQAERDPHNRVRMHLITTVFPELSGWNGLNELRIHTSEMSKVMYDDMSGLNDRIDAVRNLRRWIQNIIGDPGEEGRLPSLRKTQAMLLGIENRLRAAGKEYDREVLPKARALQELKRKIRGQKSFPFYSTKTLKDHKYGCLMAVLPDGKLRQDIVNFVLEIPECHLGADGSELRPHVTVKYGFEDSDPETIQALKSMLARIGPIEIELGDLSLFEGVDGQDVLKIDVHSPILHQLHENVSEAFRNADKHPTYQPHLTLAYLEPGVSASYIKDNPFKGQRVAFTSLEWAGADGRKETIPLSFLGMFRDERKSNASHASTKAANAPVARDLSQRGGDGSGSRSEDRGGVESTGGADSLCGGNPFERLKTLSFLAETSGGALVPPAEQDPSKKTRTILLTTEKAYPTPPSVRDSYFSRCERDEGGQCLPEGMSGTAVDDYEPSAEDLAAIEQEYGDILEPDDMEEEPEFPGIQQDPPSNDPSPELMATMGGIKKPKTEFKTKDINSVRTAIDDIFPAGFDKGLIGAMCCGIDGMDTDLTAERSKKGYVLSSRIENFEPNVDISIERRFFKDPRTGELMIYNDAFFIGKKSPHLGKGAEIFANQVLAAQKAGVRKMETLAIGHGPESIGSKPKSINSKKSHAIGYYTWPLLGYEGKIKTSQFSNLPADLQKKMGKSRSIQDLYAIEGGSDAWLKYGSTISLKFDLANGSRSMKKLDKYMKDRKNETPEQREARRLKRQQSHVKSMPPTVKPSSMHRQQDDSQIEEWKRDGVPSVQGFEEGNAIIEKKVRIPFGDPRFWMAVEEAQQRMQEV